MTHPRHPVRPRTGRVARLALLAAAVAAPAWADPPPAAPAEAPDPAAQAFERAFQEASRDPRARAAPEDDELLPRIAVERYTLPNGLDVLLAPGGSERQAVVSVTYLTGTGDCPPERAALAHLAEHLSYGRTRHSPDGLLAEVERAGATFFNGLTHPEETTYIAVVPSGSVERMLWIESERMAYALDGIDDAAVAHERHVVINEYRQRVTDGGLGDLALAMARELYPAEHLHRVPYALPDGIAAVTTADVRAFIARSYVPANARLSVVGRFDPAVVRSWVERYFGPVPRAPAPPRTRLLGPGQVSGERLLRFRVPSADAMVMVVWPTPALRAPGDTELDIVSELLTSHVNGALTAALVGRGLATSVSSRQHSHADGSEFVIEVVLRPSRTADQVLEAIDRTLAQLRREAPPAARVAAASRRFVRATVADARSPLSRAFRFEEAREPGDPGAYRADLDRYRGVAATSLPEVVSRHLPLDRRLVVLVEPSSGAPVGGVAEPVRSR